MIAEICIMSISEAKVMFFTKISVNAREGGPYQWEVVELLKGVAQSALISKNRYYFNLMGK